MPSYRWNSQPCVIVRKYEENGHLYVVIQTKSAPGHHTERIIHVLASTFQKAQEAKP
jgi:hypothetical protein